MKVNLQKHAASTRSNPYSISPDIIYRWSPRKMSGQKLNRRELIPLFEAARWAPSSNNNQPWEYHVAHSETKKFDDYFSFLNLGNQEWCRQASCLVILVSQQVSEYKNKFIESHSFDAGASFMGLAIEGIRQNIVVHPIGGFDKLAAYKYLKLNETKTVECMIALGKPSESETESISNRNKIDSFVYGL